MAETFRAFVAVEVGPLPGMVSLLDGLRATGADLKLVDPRNLHLTVKFLGDTDAARIPDIADAMTRAVAGEAPFDAHLEGVRTFGPKRSPRVVHVAFHDEGGVLARIAARLDDALAAAGIAEPESRAFKPHVTLARSRSPRGADAVREFVTAHGNAVAGEVRVDGIRLMRSDLTREGPRYSEVARAPLGGA